MKYSIINSLVFILLLILLSGCEKSPENGVSLHLAKDRKVQISNIDYYLQFSIPESKSEQIIGNIAIDFLAEKKKDIVIDFRENESKLKSVKIDNQEIDFSFKNGHIIIPKEYIKIGKTVVTIDFIAGESSLNRKDEFLYTLLVPDRASTVFPCFDQPDLKAVYNLSLELPLKWTAITNGATIKTEIKDSTKIESFGPTEPISTYLFAFVAGKFDSITHTENGRAITVYHRENDSLKVKRNLDAIFTSHFHSLNWLEDYTGIKYPFGKLDIILIPDFQYSGMEHPGAIYYRDSQLFLDENPSVNQKLRQANLIAHEVSHQWFGDLVTMRWFNDVWLKEVFAGFMADKIVNPQYPKVNHQLNFLLSHYPRAYSIDRTEGANPIRQKLNNLLFAGTLYGDIIYHKAPIMMMQLELLMGSDTFKTGVRKYLETYSMANADWEELVSILDPLTPKDLKTWSKAWVDLPGMPEIKSNIAFNDNGNINEYRLIQSKPKTRHSRMGMKFSVSQNTPSTRNDYNVEMINDTLSVLELKNKSLNGWILPNTDGKGYGGFYPDSISLNMILNKTQPLDDDLTRSSWFVMLNELFLNGKVDADKYYSYLITNLAKETEPQTRQYLLSNLELVWWKFFSDDQRKSNSKHFESSLFQLIHSAAIKDDERKPLFWSFIRIASNDEAKEQIYKIWNNEIQIKGIKLDESDYMVLACELAVRNYGNIDSIISVQESSIKNVDRLAKFRFMKRAISPDLMVRDSFFNSLLEAKNRRPEPWVTEALRYFHHPLRAEYSIKYIKPSLDLLPEIQKTGDIFFPKSWLEVTLWGYNSKESNKIVKDWLKDNKDLPKSLRDKVLQSADNLKRASKM
ncbi:MAG: M1 family aminopeptidase [Tenuifilaceae bacterium]